MDSVHCYNKGCGQKFDPIKNEKDSCRFHPGQPVFHDALKGWSCCKKRSTDFTEFLNFPGCTTGLHSNDKPKEPEKPKETVDIEVKEEAPKLEFQRQKPPTLETERPSEDEPLQTLPATVVPALQKALEKKLQEMSLESNNADGPMADGTVQVGTCCKNNACKGTYQSAESNTEVCNYHPGVAIFHEGMKYWSCCQRKTSDFTNFLEQAGCEAGKHLWVKKETAGSKKTCRMDWFQTSPNVIISVFAKLSVPEQTVIEVNQVRCKIYIVFEAGKSVYENDIILKNPIIPEQSSVKLTGAKVEVTLKKKEMFSWPCLESKQPVANDTEDKPEK